MGVKNNCEMCDVYGEDQCHRHGKSVGHDLITVWIIITLILLVVVLVSEVVLANDNEEFIFPEVVPSEYVLVGDVMVHEDYVNCYLLKNGHDYQPELTKCEEHTDD